MASTRLARPGDPKVTILRGLRERAHCRRRAPPLANEFTAEERRETVRAIERLALDLPIATFATKPRIAERIVAGDVRFVIE